MKTEHYFCDQCKKEVEVKNAKSQLIKLVLGAGSPHTSSYSYNRFDVYKQVELCFECAEKVGFVIKDDAPIKNCETTQDRLYNVMRDIIQEQSQS